MAIKLLDHHAAATVRTRVAVPLRFPDGFAAAADVFTFRGLADGQEHLLLGLGDWRGALERSAAGGDAPLVRPHSECLTGDVFGSASAATAGRSCGRRSSGSPRPAASCSTCVRRAAASVSTPSSTPTRCRTPGLDTYQANLALGHGEDERDYTRRGPDAARRRRRPDPAAEQQPRQGRPARRATASPSPSGSPPASTCPRPTPRYLWAKRDHTAHTLDLERHPDLDPAGEPVAELAS